MLELLNEKEQGGLKKLLLDAENVSPIKLTDENENRITLEQVFVYEKEEQLYCILVPLNDIEGVDRGTAFVFKLVDDKLKLEVDEEICTYVFREYYDAVRETNLKKGA